MAKFSYTAKNSKGVSVSGVLDANSRPGALEVLSKQGLKPLVVKEVKTGFDPNNLNISFLKSKKVKNKDLVIFTRQLATMINAGVPLVRSLATLQSQTENEFFKGVLEDVSKDVEGGSSFADALAKHPKVFNEVYVNMVGAGEAGGILDEILKKLAQQQEKQATMRKKIKSASAYPVILMVITFAAFFGLMLFVVPKIGQILLDLGGEDAELPPYTQVMLGVSDFMVQYWIIIMVIMVGGFIAFRRYIKTPKGRYKWHSFLLKVPILNTIINKVAIARFARIFASLMSAGVGVLDALNVTGKAIGNDVIEKELAEAAQEVKNGRQLSEPLSKSKTFPPIVAQMLAIGEETGQIDTILLKIADFYEEEVDATIDGIASIIEPIMIVIMGAMVGLIAISVIGPISSISQNIGG